MSHWIESLVENEVLYLKGVDVDLLANLKFMKFQVNRPFPAVEVVKEMHHGYVYLFADETSTPRPPRLS